MNVNSRRFIAADGYQNSSIAYAEPPDIVVHLLDMQPLIDDKLIENPLVLKFYASALLVSKDAPSPTRLVDRFRPHVDALWLVLQLASSSLLPLWEKVVRTQSASDEGFSPRIETPHPASLREATLSHKGRG
ncbi:hypothetical protein [Bradyrhizobium sp. SK17]|uniref:hypothetical protein n=1 Tax=Bradyrhizobium sp. SK17 TaxID=2057741 RepID=UPI0012FD1250|nr:hypothetical protein [Bradyrhizobium sp. SK17]